MLGLLAISLPFCLLASVMAFMITYGEYQKHGFSRERLLREALSTAVFAFLLMFGIMVIICLFFTMMKL